MPETQAATEQETDALKAREDKARAIVDAGAVTIIEAGPKRRMAHVQGSEAQPYEVTWDGKAWDCTCPSQRTPTFPCKHILATEMVVDRLAKGDRRSLVGPLPDGDPQAEAAVDGLPAEVAQEERLGQLRQDHVPQRQGLLPVRVVEQPIVPTEQEMFAIDRFAQAYMQAKLMRARQWEDPADVMMAAIKAQELGVPVTYALDNMYAVQGQIAINTKFMKHLLLRTGKVAWETLQSDNKTCEIRMRRLDLPMDETATFTMEDAQQAGLVMRYSKKTGKYEPQPAWKNWTADMLWARCFCRLARRVAEDLLGGVGYTPDEIEPSTTVKVVDNDLAYEIPPKSPEEQPVDAEFTRDEPDPEEELAEAAGAQASEAKPKRVIPEEEPEPEEPPDEPQEPDEEPDEEPGPDLWDLEEQAELEDATAEDGAGVVELMTRLQIPVKYHVEAVKRARAQLLDSGAAGELAGEPPATYWTSVYQLIYSWYVDGKLQDVLDGNGEEASGPEPDDDPEPEEADPNWDFEGKAHMEDGHIVLDFGKHQGKALADLPNNYLRWVIQNKFPEHLKLACKKTLEARQ